MSLYAEEAAQSNPADVTGTTTYTMCTDSSAIPVCPPDVTCLNNACTECDYGELKAPTIIRDPAENTRDAADQNKEVIELRNLAKKLIEAAEEHKTEDL